MIGRGLVVNDVLQAQCQEEDGEGGAMFTGDTTETEGLLLESAGSLIGPLAAVVGGAKILKSLQPMMTLLVKKMVRKLFYIHYFIHACIVIILMCHFLLQTTCKTVANHSFVMGTLAEVAPTNHH